MTTEKAGKPNGCTCYPWDGIHAVDCPLKANPMLMTTHKFNAMPETGMAHLCIACGQPEGYPFHSGPWNAPTEVE